MVTRVIQIALVLLGLLTFFLPLVHIEAPVVGAQAISGWSIVKPGQEEKPKRGSLGLGDSLRKIQTDLLRRKLENAPFSVKQAYALVVVLPLAYVSLIVGAISLAWKKRRVFQYASGTGLAAAAYSLLSVFWLSRGVSGMVAESGGSRIPLLGRITRSVAEKVAVNPEIGLYVLAVTLAVLLASSFLTSAEGSWGQRQSAAE